GGDGEPVGIDRPSRARVDIADGDDAPVPHADVARERRPSGAVEEETAADDEIEIGRHGRRRYCRAGASTTRGGTPLKPGLRTRSAAGVNERGRSPWTSSRSSRRITIA